MAEQTLTTYRVLVTEQRSIFVWVDAPDRVTAVEDAEELAGSAPGDEWSSDDGFESTDCEAMTPPEGTPVWTGGPDGNWR